MLENRAEVQADALALNRRRAAEAYRADAALWEHIAERISLIPDREYLLSTALELRAKAAALEAAAAGPPTRDGEPVSGDAPVAGDDRTDD